MTSSCSGAGERGDQQQRERRFRKSGAGVRSAAGCTTTPAFEIKLAASFIALKAASAGGLSSRKRAARSVLSFFVQQFSQQLVVPNPMSRQSKVGLSY
jgi:hypothetical protein